MNQPDLIRFTAEEQNIEFKISDIDAAPSLESPSDGDSRDYSLRALLSQLIDDGDAVSSDQAVLVPHDVVAKLDAEEKRTLGLPESYPFAIDITAHGRMTDQSFRYEYRFIDAAGQPFVSPVRTGALIKITQEQSYVLSSDIFYLVDLLDQFNAGAERADPSEKLLKFAEIKEIANNVGVLLDNYLSSQDVVSPNRLRVQLRQSGDEIEVIPILSRVCEDHGDAESEIIDSGEFVPTMDEEIFEDETQEQFLRGVDRFQNGRNIYSIGSRTRIVLDEPQKEAIQQFKQIRHISGTEKDLFLENPQAFLDPETVYLDDFSDRVKEIGAYTPEAYPFLRPQKEPWLPPEGGILIEGTQILIPQDQASELKKRLEEAVDKNQKEVIWQGQSIPANTETIGAVERLIASDYDVSRSDELITGGTDGNEESTAEKRILIIKDNFEADEHHARADIRPGEPGLPQTLLPNVIPLPHQIAGIAWLQNLWKQGAHGALLADDMGLGKTLQALCFMAWCRELMDAGLVKPKPMLIVAPVALLTNWAEEYERFLEPIFGNDMLMLHGANLRNYKREGVGGELDIRRETDVRDIKDIETVMAKGRGLLLHADEIASHGAVLTTYETIRDYQFSLGRIAWGVMVIDEAQKVKTPTTMVTLAVKAMNYDFGLSMTGTPVENSWVDLWSLMDFSQPGHLGSRKDFAKEYYHPLQKEGTDIEALGNRLFAHIDGLMKRRMKEDHLEGLPAKTVHSYPVEMPQVQLDRYMEVVEGARSDNLADNRGQIFRTIGILRDVSLCPYLPFYDDNGLAEMSHDSIVSSSARLIKTFELLDDIKRRSEKAIIFLVSKKMQRVLRPIIHRRYGLFPNIINGDVAGGRRKPQIDAFQETVGFNVIIISTEAGGVGLNITGANHVIHLSRVWNPAKEDQATDRVYRIGQDKDVMVHLPLAVHAVFDNETCRGAFDQKLHRLLEDKRHLSHSVLYPGTVTESDLGRMGDEILGFVADPHAVQGIDMDAVDKLTPLNFEALINELYRAMGKQVERTPESHDGGADLVVLPRDPQDEGLLIQCKHTINFETVQNKSGVSEIISARAQYQREYDMSFALAVATNAKAFSLPARQAAAEENVTLMTRSELQGDNAREKWTVY